MSDFGRIFLENLPIFTRKPPFIDKNDFCQPNISHCKLYRCDTARFTHDILTKNSPKKKSRKNHVIQVDFGQLEKCMYLLTISIETFDKIRIFDQNFDFWQKFWFWQKFRLLTKVSIFDKTFDFLTKVSTFDKRFDFWQKFRLFDKSFGFWQIFDCD